jgi:hypothetical protein
MALPRDACSTMKSTVARSDAIAPPSSGVFPAYQADPR